MESNSMTRTARSIINKIRREEIVFDAFFQRKSGQWNNAQKGLLIDSILRRYPIPMVYAMKQQGEDTRATLSVIDGCQRLTTISEFVNGGFRLPRNLSPIVEKDGSQYEIAGKTYKVLPEVLQDIINDCSITICTIEDASPDEIIELFSRLNNGTPLTPAQKNKALMGYEMTKRVAEIAAKPVFERFLSPTQAKRDEGQMVVVQSLMLMTQDDGTGMRKKQVQNFITSYVDQFRESDFDRLSILYDSLEGILGEDEYPALKKTAVPPVIKVLDEIEDTPDRKDVFAARLREFLEDPTAYPEYAEHVLAQTTDRDHVEGRVDFFRSLAE